LEPQIISTTNLRSTSTKINAEKPERITAGRRFVGLKSGWLHQRSNTTLQRRGMKHRERWRIRDYRAKRSGNGQRGRESVGEVGRLECFGVVL
jgi:hypothetical protein